MDEMKMEQMETDKPTSGVELSKIAVIVAGGTGVRMNTAIPKQFLLLKGKPILYYTIKTFLQAFNDVQIIFISKREARRRYARPRNVICFHCKRLIRRSKHQIPSKRQRVWLDRNFHICAVLLKIHYTA